MTLLSIAITAIAGLAIFALAVMMIHAIDLRNGRWLVSAGWLAAAFAGIYMTFVPAAHGVPMHWTVLVLGVSFAVSGWMNFDRLLAQATSPSPWRPSARYAGAGAIAGAVALQMPATAMRAGPAERAVRPAAAMPEHEKPKAEVPRAKVG